MTRTIKQPDKDESCRDPQCAHPYAAHTGPAAACAAHDCLCRAFNLREIPLEWPCRRCGHPYSAHQEENTGCSVELTTSPVPSLDFGGVCRCAGFDYEPASEPASRWTPDPLDGPRMLADALGYVRLARTASSSIVKQEMMLKALPYFAGASAVAMAEIAADNRTGDITERRWRAALAGEPTLPEDVQP